MLRWRWGAMALCVMVWSACRPPTPPADPVFRSLRAVTVSDADALPDGQLRLSAYVLEIGIATDGTYLKLTDSPSGAQQMILVYGTPVDMIFAQHLQGQRVEIEFKTVGRTKLPDGSPALHVSITGMRANAPPTPHSP